MDEQLVDTDSEKQSSENIIQKINTSINDKEYKIFTNHCDLFLYLTIFVYCQRLFLFTRQGMNYFNKKLDE